MADTPTPATAVTGDLRDEMLDEGRRLVDAARSQGLTLRLLGGLAVRQHCHDHELCARDYSDLDMVAPAKQARRLAALLATFGYRENFEVSSALNAALQFVRPCEHGARPANPAHAEDHIDVFLDTFRMDHDIALARRLEIEPYTLSLSDLLLTKLQIFRLNDKDVRDMVTLLGDAEVGDEDAPGTINGRYIARLCADDWGLFHDVAMNLQRVHERVAIFALDPPQETRVLRGVTRLIAAIDGTPKTLRWRLRARVGTRTNWHNELEGQD